MKEKLLKPFKQVAYKANKHSPELLLGAGVVGLISATVLACNASRKVDDILEEHFNSLGNIKHAVEELSDVYSKTDSAKDVVITYAGTTRSLVKLYSPSVILGGLSLAAIFGSHRILKGRNVALAAAYTALDETYKAYRERVVEEYGEKKDYDLSHGIIREKVKETYTDKDGKKKTKTVEKTRFDARGASKYARFFDEYAERWSPDPYMNLTFLRHKQAYWNDILRLRGQKVVFLNEIYEDLGFERTKEGQIVGWVYESEAGDGYIDFGFDKFEQFLSGHEKSVLLDFNVDGIVYDIL